MEQPALARLDVRDLLRLVLAWIEKARMFVDSHP
jgi:hypothetical protein